MPLWRASDPIVLASKSEARRMLLAAAGIPVEIDPANIDERAIEGASGRKPGEVAELLAAEKAKAVSPRWPGRLVLGADQTLAMGAERFGKPADRDAARAQLRKLQGRTHELHSALSIVRDGIVLFAHCEVARMTMRNFSESFLEDYLDEAGDAVKHSVGGYQLEKIGVQLFMRIDGDHSTILGLPLLPLLDWMRRAQLLTE